MAHRPNISGIIVFGSFIVFSRNFLYTMVSMFLRNVTPTATVSARHDVSTAHRANERSSHFATVDFRPIALNDIPLRSQPYPAPRAVFNCQIRGTAIPYRYRKTVAGLNDVHIRASPSVIMLVTSHRRMISNMNAWEVCRIVPALYHLPLHAPTNTGLTRQAMLVPVHVTIGLRH